MQKIFNKKIAAVALCAVFALGGAALVSHAHFAALAKEEAPENGILLDAGAGTLGGTSKQVIYATKDNKLPELPVPTREGWDFVGWFDSEVVENFWGDEEYENPQTDDYLQLKATYGNYKNIYYNYDVTPVEKLSENFNRGWKELTFNWISATYGDVVKMGDEAIANTLYAMYKPDTYTVHWHLNGWQNSYNAPHRTMPSHGGYFVEYELDTFSSLAWKNHSFLGWYLDPECTQQYSFRQVGAYKVSEQAATGDLHLYAKWESSVPFDGEIRTKKPANLTEPKLNSTFSVTCAYTLGDSRDMPVITNWESSEPESIAFVSYDPSTSTAVFKIENTAIFNSGNKEVTIYATVDGVKHAAAEMTFGHSWGGIVREKSPTCTQPGETVYGCKYCSETRTVYHAADGHRFVETNHPATCTQDAFVETHCITCNLTEITVIENSATGHVWSEQTIANCEGTTVITTCLSCGLTHTAFDPEAVAHDWDCEYTVDRAATCADEGQKSIHCHVCGARSEITAIPVTQDHVWGEWIVESEATEEHTGTQVHYCEICGRSESEEIPVIPAEPEVEEPEVEEPQPEEPGVTEPEVVEPEIEEPEVEEPQPEQPEVTEPEVVEPQPEEPEVTEPEVVEPQPEQPEITQPEVVEPQPEEPEITQPEIEESQPEEPEITQPEVDEAVTAKSAGASAHLDAQSQLSGDSNGWMQLFALICLIAVLAGGGTAVIVVFCNRSKHDR